MNVYEQNHAFLTSELVGGEWSASCSSRFTPGEGAFGAHWTEVWAAPKAGMEDVKKRKLLNL